MKSVILNRSLIASRLSGKTFSVAIFAAAIAVSTYSSPSQATRRHAKPVVETPENSEAIPTRLVVDTSGEENRMDKAAFEKAAVKDANSEASQAVLGAAAAGGSTATPTIDTTSKASSGAGSGAGIDVDAALAQAKKDATARLPENEIPVLTKVSDEKKEASGGMTRIFITLGVLLAAFGAASFGLKRWSARSPKSRNENTKIRVLTQHHLGPKKTLAIIQVAGESILIGITDHNIAMIKTLALIDDEVPVELPNSFAGAMTDMEFDDDMDDSGQNFALRGLSEIRDVVSQRLGKGR